MSAVNQVVIVGHLGLDPERRESRSGTPSVKLRVATSRSWTDKDGVRQEQTEWHTVRVFGPQAEACHRYLETGRLVCVEGRLHHYSWETEQKEKRWSTEIVARQVTFLGGRGRGDARGGGSEPAPPPPAARDTGATGSARQPLF